MASKISVSEGYEGDQAYEPTAQLLKAAGDRMRLLIIRVLSSDSYGVQELADIFAIAQPRMSHHLKVLSRTELLTPRRQGNTIFYRRTNLTQHRLEALIRNIFDEVDRIEIPDVMVERINMIHRERSEASREFFEKNAEIFDQRQGELCDFEQYKNTLIEVLDVIPDLRRNEVLEVGPGYGELLPYLLDRFQSIVALDSSKEMLQRAVDRHGKSKRISFVHESLSQFSRTSSTRYDLVAMNMVLHHMSSPVAVFTQAKKLIKANGFMLVADLCAHDQDWVKGTCGDLWQGFTPTEMEQWALSNDFEVRESLFLGLKNGFQIQVKLFQSRV